MGGGVDSVSAIADKQNQLARPRHQRSHGHGGYGQACVAVASPVRPAGLVSYLILSLLRAPRLSLRSPDFPLVVVVCLPVCWSFPALWTFASSRLSVSPVDRLACLSVGLCVLCVPPRPFLNL